MSRLVVDASVIAPLIVPDEHGDLIQDVLDALLTGDAVAPQHWRLEVANLARMAVRRRRLEEDALDAIFADLREMVVEIDSETDRLAWTACLDVSRRRNITVYDAAYLELALRLDLPIATRDRRLADAATAEGVELISA